MDSVISFPEVMGRNRFDSVCVQPLEGVMHRKHEDEKVTPASATQKGFYLCARKNFLLNIFQCSVSDMHCLMLNFSSASCIIKVCASLGDLYNVLCM